MEKHISIVTKLMPNPIHHHGGVLPSITPAMRSEIQPIPRRLLTKGTRSNSGGGAWSFNDVATSAIRALLSPSESPLENARLLGLWECHVRWHVLPTDCHRASASIPGS